MSYEETILLYADRNDTGWRTISSESQFQTNFLDVATGTIRLPLLYSDLDYILLLQQRNICMFVWWCIGFAQYVLNSYLIFIVYITMATEYHILHNRHRHERNRIRYNGDTSMSRFYY